MPDNEPASKLPPPLIALAGWVLPGLGYWLIGERTRGLIAGVTILVTFLLGILIGGIRVIDVPGYDRDGNVRYLQDQGGRRHASSALREQPLAEIFNKPWFIGQIFAGPTAIAAGYASVEAAYSSDVEAARESGLRDWRRQLPPENQMKDPPVPMSTARVFDIGTLYAAVAGMLNLLVMIDAAHRASKPVVKESEPIAPITAAPSTLTPSVAASLETAR